MPVTPTFPGVYIEEIPSGVRTITGVATSITAFIGGAPRGPVNEPMTINNFGDYERVFGGLSLDSPMSYCRARFLSQRRQPGDHRPPQQRRQAATITLPADGSPPGSAAGSGSGQRRRVGQSLSALVDHNTKDSANQQLVQPDQSRETGRSRSRSFSTSRSIRPIRATCRASWSRVPRSRACARAQRQFQVSCQTVARPSRPPARRPARRNSSGAGRRRRPGQRRLPADLHAIHRAGAGRREAGTLRSGEGRPVQSALHSAFFPRLRM